MAAASVTASLTLTCILQQINYLPSGDYGVVFGSVKTNVDTALNAAATAGKILV